MTWIFALGTIFWGLVTISSEAMELFGVLKGSSTKDVFAYFLICAAAWAILVEVEDKK